MPTRPTGRTERSSARRAGDDEEAAGADAAHRTRDAASHGYSGEFEQRTLGERGTGPAGEVRARESLLAALRSRIADDPELARCDIRVGLDPQGIELAGTVPNATLRQRLQALAEAAGVGLYADRVRVGAPDGSPARP